MSSNLWWHKSIEDTISTIVTDIDKGLNKEEVNKRQLVSLNRLKGNHKISPLKIFLSQFTETMVLVLLGATVVSGIIGDMVDAITIMAIVIINAVLGFAQEYKAEKSLEEIKKLASPDASVIREGQRQKIAAEQLVPGDIVLLDAGDKVPADLRLLESFGLEVDESALTGESHPVEKSSSIICDSDTVLAERVNMLFMGCSLTRGRAKAVVVGTGMQTIMGEIAGMMQQSQQSMTPLQIKLNQLGKILIIICLLVCAMVIILGILRGENTLTMFMAGISLAVAAIPEGLPAIVTVVLALGVQRMAGRKAIVRKLPAVETLGCTTVICSDKTGTLTRNEMTVKKLFICSRSIDIEGNGFKPEGKFFCEQSTVYPCKQNELRLIMDIALNCNNSSLIAEEGQYKVQGDPTEGALLVMAGKSGFKEHRKSVKEIPFDSERKMMSVVVEKNGEYFLYLKGALELVIKSCTHVEDNGRLVKITADYRNYFLEKQEDVASQAMRVLAFAYRKLKVGEWQSWDDKKLESSMTLLGICGMIDPPRPDAARSVKDCLDAGIIPVMITGDHPLTAASIAREIGISSGQEVIKGSEIDGLSNSELYKRAVKERVFARVSPQHKNRIVNIMKQQGHVVAMTGDGVNDAPAIKEADIGIAMGITGTQVSKEASSMILLDDDFSTIVKAIYEGRAIYDNIRKFIRYLLGCNIGEVLVMFISSLLGMPLPLLPIQILWVNLVTDGLPAMALGLEYPEPDVMQRKPRAKNESIFARGMGWIILGRGSYIAVITIAVFLIGLLYSEAHGIQGLDLARTMTLTTLVFAQLFYVFECRSENMSPFELGFFANSFLTLAVLCSITMQLSVIYLPVFQEIFHTVALELWSWIIILLLSASKLIWKLVVYHWQGFFMQSSL